MRVIGDRPTNLDFWLKWQEGWRNWKGTVRCILPESGTYNSRNVFLLLVVYGSEVLADGASGRLLGLLPIRSADEGTEKSEDGDLLIN